jgi:RHS repeat-associated protein
MRVGAPADPNYSLGARRIHPFGMNGLVTSSLIYDGDGNVTYKSTDGVTTTCASDAFGNGAPRVIVSHACTSNLVQTLDSYPYGATRISVSTSTNEKRKWIGQFLDDSNLVYDNARYYNPNQGQFVSEEPIFLSLGDANQVAQMAGRNQQTYLTDPQVFNAYSYGRDNPISNKDTNGKLVELVSRPIDGPVGAGFAHAFLYVIPDNPSTIGSIPHVDTSQPFTLSGTPQDGQLMKTSNYGQDYFYATCGRLCPGGSSVTVAPPPGVSSAQFDANVVTSYNNAPANLGKYFFWGTPAHLARQTPTMPLRHS